MMFRSIFGVMLLGFFGVSCSAPSPLLYKGISHVTLEPVSLSASRVKFTIDVNNPNKYSLSVKSWEALLLVDARQVGQFSSDSAFDIPANADYSYTTTLPVEHSAILNGALQWLVKGYVPYTIKGSARAGRKAIKATIPFSYDGQFALKDILGK